LTASRYNSRSDSGAPKRIQHANSRAQTSNIADGAYLGTEQTLACFSARLKAPEANPHATLITLYMNAVEEAARSTPPSRALQLMERRRIEPYVSKGTSPGPRHPLGKESMLLQVSLDLGRDVDLYFDRYGPSTPLE
jgi:hypothetical protein